jgi:hypothetical protein
LCRPHQIAVAEASRTRGPAEIIADSFVSFLQGQPINMQATIGAVEQVINQWSGMAAGYHPDVDPGQREDTVHRNHSDGRRRPWWWTPGQSGPQQPPSRDDPRAQQRLQQVREARRAMGFTQGEVLTAEDIKIRHRRLVKKHHPDRGGSTEKMARINSAADVLMEELDRV